MRSAIMTFIRMKAEIERLVCQKILRTEELSYDCVSFLVAEGSGSFTRWSPTRFLLSYSGDDDVYGRYSWLLNPDDT